MEVKDRILDKANALFRRYGIKSITMDEIASQLGISKKTIYQYFADKEELISSVMDQKIKESQENCLFGIRHAENAIHEEFLVQDKVLEHLDDLNPVALHDLEKFHPSVHEKFVHHKNDFMMEMVENNLRRGIREGLYRPEIRVNILSRFRMDSIYRSLSADFLPGSSVGLGELHQELFLHYLFGIASPEGYKLIRQYLEERKAKPAVLPV
jgi:TetR/AcrR family transcriptional regulator, cholesterol catabolism regulator